MHITDSQTPRRLPNPSMNTFSTITYIFVRDQKREQDNNKPKISGSKTCLLFTYQSNNITKDNHL